MAKNTQSGPKWVQPLVDVVQEFAETAPLLGDKKSNFAELEFCGRRLTGIVASLREAELEGDLAEGHEALVLESIERLNSIQAALKTASVTVSGPQFFAFDDEAFARRTAKLPEEDLRTLLRWMIGDPRSMNTFEAVSRNAMFVKYGLPTLAMAGPTVILFKLVVILILLLVVISFPPLIPLALAIISALAVFDRAGSSHENDGDNPSDTPPPTIFGEEIDEEVCNYTGKFIELEARGNHQVGGNIGLLELFDDRGTLLQRSSFHVPVPSMTWTGVGIPANQIIQKSVPGGCGKEGIFAVHGKLTVELDLPGQTRSGTTPTVWLGNNYICRDVEFTDDQNARANVNVTQGGTPGTVQFQVKLRLKGKCRN